MAGKAATLSPFFCFRYCHYLLPVGFIPDIYRECCVFWNNGAENGATEDPMEALLGGKWS